MTIPSSSSSSSSPLRQHHHQQQHHSLRSALIEYYGQHNPEKIDTIDVILETYKGHEQQLLKQLKEKYNQPVPYILPSLSTEERSPNRRQGNNNVNNNANNILPSSISDISKNLAKGLSTWGLVQPSSDTTNNTSSTSITSSTNNNNNIVSNADDMLWMSRINALQSEVNSLEHERNELSSTCKKLKSSMNLSKTQNNKLQISVNDLTIRIESLQRNLATSLEKEAVAVREARLLNEQLKNGDKGKVELHNQLLAVMKQKDNKHTQLCETIALNHKLGAQVRFLASQVFAECHHGLGLTNYNEEIKNIEMQVNTNINNDNTEYDDNSIYSDNIIATKTIEELIVDIKALRTKADVLQSSYLASRAELQIALRQQTFAEERTVEQQNMIDSLQSRLSNIQNEKETASGNADSLRKQITETNSELNRYKLLLAVAERKVVEKDSELSELKDDITALKDNLSVSECAKKDLISLCADHARSSERSALEYVRTVSERVLLEREELLSRISKMSELERDVRLNVSLEAQKELQRLRDELFKSRRAEAQRDHEVSFLQSQLGNAADRIAELEREKEIYLVTSQDRSQQDRSQQDRSQHNRNDKHIDIKNQMELVDSHVKHNRHPR